MDPNRTFTNAQVAQESPYVGTASMRLIGDCVGMILVSDRSAAFNILRYSSSVRSRPPGHTNIQRSRNFVNVAASAGGTTNSISNKRGVDDMAFRQQRRICSARSSGQSWIIFLRNPEIVLEEGKAATISTARGVSVRRVSEAAFRFRRR
jgi:hypothetical protein